MSGWLPAIALGLCLSLGSCDLSEDLSECVTEVETGDMALTFRFTRDGANLFGTEVPSLSVFAFDEYGLFVGRFDEPDRTKFTEEYAMRLPLPPGEYRFVVWGGLSDPNYYIGSMFREYGHVASLVVGGTSIEELTLRVARNTRNSYTEEKTFVDHIPGALFYGRTEPVTLLANEEREVTVDLKKLNKQINLTVIGLPEATTRASAYDHMDISLGSANGCYDFMGVMAEDRQHLTWVQHDVADGTTTVTDEDTQIESEVPTQTSTLHTLDMQFGHDYTFTVYNTEKGGTYEEDMLSEYIYKTKGGKYDTQEEVDAEDVFDVVIDISDKTNWNPEGDSYVGVTVTINGYEVENPGSIIQ
jgi:hypothetical protein